MEKCIRCGAFVNKDDPTTNHVYIEACLQQLQRDLQKTREAAWEIATGVDYALRDIFGQNNLPYEDYVHDFVRTSRKKLGY